jgi:hypothetical protein
MGREEWKPLLCPPLKGEEMKYELPSEGRKYFSLSSQERVGVRFPPVETPFLIERKPLFCPPLKGEEILLPLLSGEGWVRFPPVEIPFLIERKPLFNPPLRGEERKRKMASLVNAPKQTSP